MMKGKATLLVLLVLVSMLTKQTSAAPVFGKIYDLRQPDGTYVKAKIWGDEFYQIVESLDGFTLVRDPKTQEICYAELSPDKNELLSTGISAGYSLSLSENIKQHIRINKTALQSKVNEARARFAASTHEIMSAQGRAEAPSPAPSTGNVKGICLIVDFPDEPGTIPPANVNDFCNQIGYSGYGNNGSVRDYFSDVSDGAVDYTNYVSPTYYTAINNKGYYDNPSEAAGPKARELIIEALTWLEGSGFDFSQYDSDSDGWVDGINCYYAGTVSSGWAMGLWPHSSAVFFSADGVSTSRYQITDMGPSLEIGTFIHENGHMICWWDDHYDYGYDSSGCGYFCLMASGSHAGGGHNPVEPCPYLIENAGWATITLLTTPQTSLAVTAGVNSIFKFPHPTKSYEYFLINNRQQTGRDAGIRDAGLAIWHVDENGSNNDQQMTCSLHYQSSLEQCDGDFDLENNTNYGDSTDLYDIFSCDEFSPFTVPNSDWWCDGISKLKIYDISASGPTMTFSFSLGSIPVAIDDSASTSVNTPVTIKLEAYDNGLPNPPGALTYIITSLPSYGELSDPNSGAINSDPNSGAINSGPYSGATNSDPNSGAINSDPNSGAINSVPYTLANNGNNVVYTPVNCYKGPDSFQFKANDGGTDPNGGDSNLATISITIANTSILLTEDFESAFVSGAPPGWTKVFKTSSVDWVRNAGDYVLSGESAHGGTYNAMLYYGSTSNHETYLITPELNFDDFPVNPTLEFWHLQKYWPPDQDTLKVYYKTSAGGSWILLESFLSNVPTWTKRTISLPNPNSTYYIGFLGNAKYGYGVCIDDVSVTGEGTTLSGDLNCDDKVDNIDFSLFAIEWLHIGCIAPDWCNGADLNADGDVGVPDLQALVGEWLEAGL